MQPQPPDSGKRFSRAARLALGAAAIGLLVVGTWSATLHWAADELIEARAETARLNEDVTVLGRRLESAQARRVQAEQEARITRQANRLLREEESARQAELQRLQGELDFYRRLAGTSGTQSGLAVYHLELTPTASARVFRFVLTLTQNLRRSAITTGTATLSIEGTLDDRPVTLPWARITEGSPPVPVFRFKYFEQLDGYLSLPEDFTPLRVLVTLDAKGPGRPVSRGFDWDDLTGASDDAGATGPGDRAEVVPGD